MKLTTIALGLLAALASANASACPPSNADHCDPKKHAQTAPWQKLHDELGLTPEQEASWKAMQDHNRARRERHFKEMQDEQAQNLNAPQRMEKRQAMMEHHEQERAEALNDFKAFYEKLNPEQQKKVDAHFSQAERMGPMHDGCEPKRLPPIKK